jgi:DNA-binding CsgD family transcriptional regulator
MAPRGASRETGDRARDREEAAMSRFSIEESDVRRLEELLSVSDGEGVALPWEFLQQVKELVGCDVLAFNGLDSKAERHFFLQSIGPDGGRSGRLGVDPADEDPIFWKWYWSSISCSYPDLTGDTTSITSISDFHSLREWHATPMYLESLGPFLQHELMACLPDGAGRTLRLLCFRSEGPDFGERERFLLRLLRPHIADAYRGLVRRRNEQQLTGRQREVLELVRVGMTNRQIARRLDLSEATVRTHLNNIFTRLDVGSRTAAATRLGG